MRRNERGWGEGEGAGGRYLGIGVLHPVWAGFGVMIQDAGEVLDGGSRGLGRDCGDFEGEGEDGDEVCCGVNWGGDLGAVNEWMGVRLECEDLWMCWGED